MEEIRRVAFCVLVDQGRALLVHRHAERRLYPDVWDLPGGHVEPGESPDSAARREVAEEVGVTVVDLELVVVPVNVPGSVTHTFVAVSWRGEPANCRPRRARGGLPGVVRAADGLSVGTCSPSGVRPRG